MRPLLQNDCTHCTHLRFVSETFIRQNFPSPKRPIAELAVGETFRRRTGDRRNVPSPKRRIPVVAVSGDVYVEYSLPIDEKE